MRSSDGQFEFQVWANGIAVREFPHQGDTFVMGMSGTEFTLRVVNNTSRQVEAVISVDGLSVMNGQPASVDDGGYIVPANGTVNITGWRRTDDKVANFYFEQLPAAYAAQMGMPTNIGVLAVTIFEEQMRWRGNLRGSMDDMNESLGGQTFRGATRGEPTRGIGTGYGRETEHRVKRVSFERGAQATQLIIRYDDEKGLKARGINLAADRVKDATPYPADKVQTPAPPNWKNR